MKEGDQSSVYVGNNFKPPDRSTSAPPVLSAESLFAFPPDQWQLLANGITDIRCEDNYYEFYNKYQNQGGKGLPPPLETQPFLMDRAYREEDDHMHPSSAHPNSHASQQQQIQQLQQQLQQQQLQHQMQQQYQQQQYQLQQQHAPPHPHQQPMHSQPHHPSSGGHYSQHQQHLSHQQIQQLQQMQQQQHQGQHPQMLHQHPQMPQLPSHPHPQHMQHMQHQGQPHMPRGYNSEHRFSVPEIRNPPPRSTSNPYMRSYERFEPVQEMSRRPQEPPHMPDDPRSTSPSSVEAIWAPLPRKVANLVLDEYQQQEDAPPPPSHAHSKSPHLQQGPQGGGRMGPPSHAQQHGGGGRDHPSGGGMYSGYQQNDFDNVAFSTASALLKEDNIQSLWNDRSYDRQRVPPHITAPTPTVASQSSLISLLGAGNGYYNDSNQDKMHQLQQDRNDQFSVVKPKAKKSVASPPPMGMGNLPPKVPSPVHRNGSGGHMSNGTGSSQSGNANDIKALLATMSAMSLGADRDRDRERERDRDRDRDRERERNGHPPATSPKPIAPPRSTTPNSQSGDGANGLDIAFAGSGSTSPNGKSDLSRQYTSIEQVIGHIYSLCKDQHGCRFLQKKLEDRDPMVVEIIFNEVYDHMTELMIDPFGNYLCQKLLEHCNDDQRLHIIEKVSPDLVKISKNMHGTRAVQKMIEYLTTPEQITIAKKALSNHVVTLIQDLNGNHVIQRCLNRLSPQDNQFIYDSVSQAGHCVEVATHRHGCCVLQRCIDHASDSQKIQLINEIIANALVLVQDPYGNYVVQYVLDLPFPGLASRLARRFLGHIPILSTQKFSSNVVEKVLSNPLLKCLNVTDIQTRASIIQELVEYDNLLYLLQDPYANYVIQTSLIVSEPVQHARLVEAIRPHLSALRNTPYGKRIQNKILKESSRDYYA